MAPPCIVCEMKRCIGRKSRKRHPIWISKNPKYHYQISPYRILNRLLNITFPIGIVTCIFDFKFNKCIGDDTKAAARQSLNCIRNKKKYGEKRFSTWRMEFLHPAMWYDHDIDFARWLHSAMWHVALESWQWIHQVVAPCNVIRGSGLTCHWIRPVAAPCNVTRSSGIMTLNSQVAATCIMAGGSGITCRWIRPNVHHIGIIHLVSTSTTSHQSTCHSAPVCEMLSKSDHPRQKKMTSCRFSRWRTSAILDFRDPIMGSLKSPIT